MALPPNVTTQVLTAQLKLANMVDANLVALSNGSLSAKWWPCIQAWLVINLVNQLNIIGDNSSPGFQAAYSCMNLFVGPYAGGTIDPNAHNPGTIVIPGGGPPPLIYTITAHVTPIPFVASYNPALYPAAEYALIRASDGSFDWNTNVVWASGSFTIIGDDDGSGFFADSYTFYINS